jgi:hypothetical protein
MDWNHLAVAGHLTATDEPSKAPRRCHQHVQLHPHRPRSLHTGSLTRSAADCWRRRSAARTRRQPSLRTRTASISWGCSRSKPASAITRWMARACTRTGREGLHKPLQLDPDDAESAERCGTLLLELGRMQGRAPPSISATGSLQIAPTPTIRTPATILEPRCNRATGMTTRWCGSSSPSRIRGHGGPERREVNREDIPGNPTMRLLRQDERRDWAL